jgi:hypothetical protein
MVGSCGKSVERRAEVTASARSRPSLMKPAELGYEAKPICV